MSESFRVVHAKWDDAPQGPAQPGVAGRVVRTASLEVHHLVVERGGSSEWEPAPVETFVQVTEGRLRLHVLGNTMDLDPTRYAVLPPNIPFALESLGRSGATALVIRG